MNYYKTLLILLFVATIATSCKQHQEARKPVSQSSGSFMKQSIERNKKLISGEEDQIKALLRSDPNKKYTASKKGYWYYYETKNLVDSLTPKKGDIALFDYEVKDLKGTTIYTQEEIGPQIYHVDKQVIMMGLRDGIKLMKKNEKVIFLFTSHMGYGYHGDNNKIGTNQPVQCIVTLNDFMDETTYNEQSKIKAISKNNVPLIKKQTIKDTITN